MKNLKLKSFFLALLLTCGVGQMWATARTFKSGEKIYFKDTWKANGNGGNWKINTGNLCAYFYGDGDMWYKCYGSDNVYGSWDAENTIYEITVPGSNKTFTGVIFTRGTNVDSWDGVWNQTTNQTPDESNNIFYVSNGTDNSKYTGSWGRYAKNAAVVGDFNGWNPDTYPLSNSGVAGALIPLEASTTYNFKILLGETYYGINSASNITSTLTGWRTFHEGQGNVPIITDVAGDYGFAWNAYSKAVTVYYPKALYQRSKYIYFDVTRETYWNANPFTARFYLKYFDSGSNLDGMPLTCSSPVEDYVYYVQVPDNGYIGQIQMNRWYNNNVDGVAEVAYVYSRSSSSQNCLKEETGKTNYQNSWTPQWTTYCPPTTSETFVDNSTAKISWQDGSNDGSISGKAILVKTGTTLKVAASASKAVNDADMTIKYDFQVNSGSTTTNTTGAYTTVASTNNSQYAVKVNMYTNYNLDATKNSTKHLHTIYFKALNTYSVAHDVNNVTKTSGRDGDDAVAYHLGYTASYTASTGYLLPDEISVSIGGVTKTVSTDYTWSVVAGTGTLTILENEIDGDVTITVNGVAKTYTDDDNIDKNGGDTDGTYIATYDATSIVIDVEPTKAGYEVEGYYTESTLNNKIAASNGELTKDFVRAETRYTDEDGNWVLESAPTLYAKWKPVSYTITLHPELGDIPGISGTGSIEATMGSQTYTPGASGRVMPQKEGYTFTGYYTSPGNVQILNANGTNYTGTAYIDGDGYWTHAGNIDVYAQWTDNGTYVFKGRASGNETSWSTAANWTKGVAPSENNGSEDIIILAPVEIPASATTNVNSVRIGTVGSYTPTGGSAITAAGKLTIPATAMLKVTNDVKNYDFSTSSATPTTTSTLHIQSASSGNGALVWGTSGTPGEAQVDFYTKSSAAGTWHGAETDVNQYIGTPFSDANVLYNYYNAWTFKVNDAGTDWERLKGNETMYPFVGYNVIYDGAAGHIFEMDGTLVPNADQTCTLSHTTAGDENLLANSWTAPIWIKGFDSENDFKNANATIYIFNSTSEKLSAGDVSATDGNYSAYTPGTAGETDVIPSMQSFSVLSTGGTGSVKLSYTNLVKNPTGLTNGPMHAPRRYNADDAEPTEELEPKMESLWLHVGDANGWADLLKIYIREDFVEEFENGFDARKMYGDPAAPTLYGISPDGRMAINCIPTADNHVLGFHAGSASNEYTFRFTYDGEDELYLLDNKTGAETLISAEDTYSFTTEAGDNDLRFSIIRKTPAVPTDIETVTGEGLQTTGVQKIMYNGKLYIIRGGRIYDATGAVVK